MVIALDTVSSPFLLPSISLLIHNICPRLLLFAMSKTTRIKAWPPGRALYADDLFLFNRTCRLVRIHSTLDPHPLA